MGRTSSATQATHQSFRKAMAAPADLPEFKGNVAAVLTENYWDMELNELTARDEKIKQEAKKIQSEKELKGKEAQAVLEELRAEEFSESGTRYPCQRHLQPGISLPGFRQDHGQIGKGFAEATADLNGNSVPGRHPSPRHHPIPGHEPGPKPPPAGNWKANW